MSRIIVAAHASFCPGVRRAVTLLEQAAAHGGEGIYCLGEIIHNRQFNDSVRQRACASSFESELDALPADAQYLHPHARRGTADLTSGLPPAGMPVPTRPVPMFGKSTRSFPRPGRTPPSSSSATKRTPRWSAFAALRANGRISAAPRRRRQRSFPHVWRQMRRQSPSRKTTFDVGEWKKIL